jgi:HD-GYP domain-containing protein (c-di-GMP phosphodiesterase class II)
MKRHVELGIKALDDSGEVDPDVREGIAQHHERLDGSGYPHGLSGASISIYGRMAGIADSFAALTSLRPYATPLAAYDALKILYSQAGTHFHAPLVEQFAQAIGIFPAGSLVELSSGEVATVLAHNRARRLEPRVLILTDPDKKLIHEPASLDLLLQPKAADGTDIKIVKGLPTGAYGLDLRQFYFK